MCKKREGITTFGEETEEDGDASQVAGGGGTGDASFVAFLVLCILLSFNDDAII